MAVFVKIPGAAITNGHTIVQKYMPSRVEWYSTFCDFRKRALQCMHVLPIRYMFYESNSKNRANLAARAAKFSFSKNHKDLKNEYLFLKFFKYLPITLKINRQKIGNKNFRSSNLANWFLTLLKETKERFWTFFILSF